MHLGTNFSAAAGVALLLSSQMGCQTTTGHDGVPMVVNTNGGNGKLALIDPSRRMAVSTPVFGEGGEVVDYNYVIDAPPQVPPELVQALKAHLADLNASGDSVVANGPAVALSEQQIAELLDDSDAVLLVQARCHYWAVSAADGTLPPEELARLFEVIVERGSDALIAEVVANGSLGGGLPPLYEYLELEPVLPDAEIEDDLDFVVPGTQPAADDTELKPEGLDL